MKLKGYFVFAVLSMAIAIAFGALGAHALKNIFDIHAIESWKTAVFYQIVHSLSVLIIVLFGNIYKKVDVRLVLKLMVYGFVIFSSSIYILSFNSIWTIEWLGKVLGPLTPIGGLLMISSWLVLVSKVLKLK